MQRLHMLKTVLDLDDLYDFLEMQIVAESWADAAYLNAKDERDE